MSSRMGPCLLPWWANERGVTLQSSWSLGMSLKTRSVEWLNSSAISSGLRRAGVAESAPRDPSLSAGAAWPESLDGVSHMMFDGKPFKLLPVSPYEENLRRPWGRTRGLGHGRVVTDSKSFLVSIQLCCGHHLNCSCTRIAQEPGRPAELFLSSLPCSNHLGHLVRGNVLGEAPFVRLSFQLPCSGCDRHE